MDWSGNTILVTGGGSGIGRGLAIEFARLGNDVIVAGRRADKLAAVAAQHERISCMTLDQSSAEDIAALAQRLARQHPALNILVNNAGIQRPEDLARGGLADAEATVTTNLLGPIRLTAALLPHLLSRPAAAIVNVSSALGFVPQALTPTYSATKAAIHSYTQSLRFQLRKTNVEVIEIVPPWVQTDLQGSHGNDPRAMPLDAFVAETSELLRSLPGSGEIVVERASGLRLAERNGVLDRIFEQMNEMREKEVSGT